MSKVGFQVGTEVVSTLAEVQEILGVSRVSMKDVQEGGKYADVVTLVDLVGEEQELSTSEEVIGEEGVGEEGVGEDDTQEGEDSTEGAVLAEAHETEDTQEEDSSEEEDEWEEGYPHVVSNVDDDEITVSKEEMAGSMPEFETLEELKDFIKDIDTPTLEYIAKALNLEWKATDHASIHRMRIAMSLHGYYFPELVKPKSDSDKKKKAAKYGDFDNKTLYKMAKENGVRWKRTENESINRMRVIMALKKAEVLPE